MGQGLLFAGWGRAGQPVFPRGGASIPDVNVINVNIAVGCIIVSLLKETSFKIKEIIVNILIIICIYVSICTLYESFVEESTASSSHLSLCYWEGHGWSQ